MMISIEKKKKNKGGCRAQRIANAATSKTKRKRMEGAAAETGATTQSTSQQKQRANVVIAQPKKPNPHLHSRAPRIGVPSFLLFFFPPFLIDAGDDGGRETKTEGARVLTTRSPVPQRWSRVPTIPRSSCCKRSTSARSTGAGGCTCRSSGARTVRTLC